MPIVDIRKDPQSLTLTIIARFDAPAERLWQIWADPRQLERWWGPPTHPATFVDHDLEPGGRATYYMTGPDGERYHGWWRFTSVDAPRSLAFVDGFADDQGNPVDDLPTTTAEVTISPLTDGRSEMVMVSTFASVEAMEQIIEMGALEGLVGALSQVPLVLAG